MVKALFLSLLIATSVYAEDNPKLMIGSVEQAITRFQQLRDTELRALLKEDQLSSVLNSRDATALSTLMCSPKDYGPGGYDDPQRRPGAKEEHPPGFIGTFTAVTSDKNPTWYLRYRWGSIMANPGLEVYLDAVTGKILYLCPVGGE